MVELLIVLTIIGILFSISFVVYGAAVESARVEATRTTIRQLDSALQERLDAFQRINLKSQAQVFKLRYEAVGTNSPATIPPQFDAIAEIIVRKDRFKAAFPQREEDLYGLDGAPGGGDDAPLLAYWTPSGSHTPETESSELLYLALTKGSVFGQSSLGIDRINANHIADTDDDGLLEFVDEWGAPLRFYGWTTSLVRPGGNLANIDLDVFRASAAVLMPGAPSPSANPLSATTYSDLLNQDSDDPTGALSDAMNSNGYFTGPFDLQGIGTCVPFDENFYHALDTYSLPLIVSAGGDGKLGLNEPTATGADRLARPIAANLDLLYDNVTNQQP